MQAHPRIGLALTFGALLAGVYWRHGRVPRVRATPLAPDVIWSIGTPDGSADEFTSGTAPALTYKVSSGSTPREWRGRQDAGRNGAIYKVAFRIDEAPGAALLVVDLLYRGVSPAGLQVDVNGKRGWFRIQPAAAPDLDVRQSNNFRNSRQTYRIAVSQTWLRRGENEISFAVPGQEGDSIEYDALRLERSAPTGEGLSAAIEPTIFYRRTGGQLVEETEVIVQHSEKLEKLAINLRVGPHSVAREAQGDGYDFGETVIPVAVPAVPGPLPYHLSVQTGERKSVFKGEFRPEKRWRLFAGLKIHNDLGYSDLQQNVEELDTRNTDGALDLLGRFPFYKFNFETGWLVDNYLNSRKPAQRDRLMTLAVANRAGINAMYLNLMTGLCTGEELYRSLYFTKGLQKKYGVPMKFACLTDAPSHTWFVPSLLTDAGVKGFGLGSNQSRAPLLQDSGLNENSPFYWEGADGRRVMAWYARSYLQLKRLVGQNPTVDSVRRSVLQILARYRRADYPVDGILLYGMYVDNAEIGSGETQILKAWNDAYEFPKITPATDADYYDYLARNFAGKLPVYRGDGGAYWEDGAGSTVAELTLNRDTQRSLPLAEFTAAWASLASPHIAYPAAQFRDAWNNMMFYDEHTWGAQASISQPDRKVVTEQYDFKRDYALRAARLTRNLLVRAQSRLVQDISIGGPTLFVFNPNIWPRTGPVETELDSRQELFEPETGQAVAVDVVAEKDNFRVLRFLAGKVPGLGYRAYGVRRLDAAPAAQAKETSPAWEIESQYYRVVLDRATGAVKQLIDKQAGRDLVDPRAQHQLNELLYASGGERTRLVQELRTQPAVSLDVTGQNAAQLIENVRTPLGRRIRIQARAKTVPWIETEITVYDGIKRVDFTNRIRKEAVRGKEAVYFAFPFRVSPPEMSYQVQNAWVRPNADQLPGACREWFATQNVVVARDAGITIAWATPDTPLFTLSDINRGFWPKRLDIRNGHVFSYALNNYWYTNYKAFQGGELTFRFSITSNRDLSPDELARFDAETRSPLAAYSYLGSFSVRLEPVKRRMPLSEGALFQVQASNANLTAFKPAEDGAGYILRLRETAGRAGTAVLQSPVFPLAQAYLTNGVEDNQSVIAVKGGKLEIPLKAWQFTTVRLIFSPSAQPAAGALARRGATARKGD